MKKATRKFLAWTLTLIMLIGSMPIDALASIITVRQDNLIIDYSESINLADDLVTSKVTSADGLSVVVTSVDEILPKKGMVLFSTQAVVSPNANRGEKKQSRRELARYDIKVVDALQNEWQPGSGETVDVTVSLPAGLELNKGEKLYLVHHPGEAEEEEVPATFYTKNGTVTGF